MPLSLKLLTLYFLLYLGYATYAISFPFWHPYYETFSDARLAGVVGRRLIEITLPILLLYCIFWKPRSSRTITFLCYSILLLLSVGDFSNGFGGGHLSIPIVAVSTAFMSTWYYLLLIPMRRHVFPTSKVKVDISPSSL